MIGITTYPSSDEDIYAAENRYAALESALNQQINEMERRHPNYDEYQYNIAEIGHNPYHLISYLTANMGTGRTQMLKMNCKLFLKHNII